MRMRTLLSMSFKSVSLAAKYTGKHFWSFLLIQLAAAVTGALLVVFRVDLFEAVEGVARGNTWTSALLPLIYMGITVAASMLCSLFSKTAAKVFSLSAQYKLQIPLNLRCAKMEAGDFESAEKLDSIRKATSGSVACFEYVNSLVMILTYYLPFILLQSIYFYMLRPALAWSALIIFLPILLMQPLHMIMFQKLENEVASIRRENDYYDRCISHRTFFKETRLLGAYDYWVKKFRGSLRRFYRESSRVEVRSGLYNLFSHLLTLAGYIAVLFLLFDSVMRGFISAGAFAAVFASLLRLILTMEDFFEEGVTKAVKSYGAVSNYIDFIYQPEEKKKSLKIANRGNIQFKDVHFRYPGAEAETIQGVDFSIRQGETLAVVGENGAGKSTLMRLIIGLYTATAGKVTADGIDLSELEPDARFDKVSAVFQKFGRYQLTVKENIMISNPGDLDQECMHNVISEADVPIDNSKAFPDGIDTLLSREFGGVDISGGQWQRLAIARGLYRAHDLIILDEPTAAIDPIEERELYKRFSRISKDKTAIIVTHRLGSARIADRILVMKEGRIDDIGTHEQLLQKNGYYAFMYNAQAEWYKG